MKTYEDFLRFLKEHIRVFGRFVPGTDPDSIPFIQSVCRFLLSEPYRFQTLLEDWPSVTVPEKPDRTVLLAFFKEHKGLPLSFRKELQAGDETALRTAYRALFPVLVRKEEFCCSVFREEIKKRKFKTVARQFDERTDRIRKKVGGLKKNPDFIQALTAFTKDLQGFSLTLIQNKNLLDQAISETIKP